MAGLIFVSHVTELARHFARPRPRFIASRDTQGPAWIPSYLRDDRILRGLPESSQGSRSFATIETYTQQDSLVSYVDHGPFGNCDRILLATTTTRAEPKGAS